jgi:hypothetical protein
LFHEAAHPFEPARLAARLVIRLLVEAGDDPSDPEFVPADCEIPEFGSVGLWLLGWPDQWVAPERTAQMQRVMKQHAHLRAGEERGDVWTRESAVALAGFLRRGEVPRRDDMRRFVLTIGEMFALHTHYFLRVGEDLLAAFEAVANASAQDREGAVLRLGKAQARHAAEGHHARS